MADELFNMIQDAYIRGATWYRKNDDFGSMLHKAAYDYADKMTSTMTIETELPAVKVKALEWKGMVPHAETIVGEYWISRTGGDWSVGLLRHGNSYEAQIASGEAPLFEIALVEAQAAAQADYERRIRSALVPSTTAESRCEELVKALERLRAALREIIDPISGMRARMNAADGEGLNGQMAITLSNSPEYLKEIARAALKELGKGDGR